MKKQMIGIAVALLIPAMVFITNTIKLSKAPGEIVVETETETEAEKTFPFVKSAYKPTPVEMLKVSAEVVVNKKVYYDVPFSKEQQDIMRNIAIENGIDFKLLLAIGYTESRFNTMAISKSGSKGVFQIQPIWWDKYIQGRDLHDLYVNTEVACKILSEMYKKYTYTRNVLNAYNTGDSTNNNGYADLVFKHLAHIKEVIETETMVVTYQVPANDTHKG